MMTDYRPFDFGGAP